MLCNVYTDDITLHSNVSVVDYVWITCGVVVVSLWCHCGAVVVASVIVVPGASVVWCYCGPWCHCGS